MTTRKRRSLEEVLAQTAPDPQPATPPPAPKPPAEHAPMGRRPQPVRSTMDLPPDEHAAFLKWAVDATEAIGRPVRGQNVLRAMVRRLLRDEEWSAVIRQDLADGLGK